MRRRGFEWCTSVHGIQALGKELRLAVLHNQARAHARVRLCTRMYMFYRSWHLRVYIHKAHTAHARAYFRTYVRTYVSLFTVR